MNGGGRLRVMIVDDEPLARANLRVLLRRDPEVEISEECANGVEAVDRLLREQIDILFLDIQMPGMSGFDVIERIGQQRMPVVVFATAHDAYALRAFDARALDYLLKPFDDERFRRALQRAKDCVREGRQAEVARRVQDVLRTRPLAAIGDRVTLRAAGKLVTVEIGAIDWIEAADYCVRIHVGAECHLVRETMERMEARLNDERFVRTHRTAIVNMERVVEIRREDSAGWVVLRGGTIVPLSRSRRPFLERRLGV